jgi:hypothetical protein
MPHQLFRGNAANLAAPFAAGMDAQADDGSEEIWTAGCKQTDLIQAAPLQAIRVTDWTKRTLPRACSDKAPPSLARVRWKLDYPVLSPDSAFAEGIALAMGLRQSCNAPGFRKSSLSLLPG